MRQRAASDSPRRPWSQHLLALLLAWVLAVAWGSLVQTQFNLQALSGLGVDVPAGVRAQTTWQDLLGFGPVYAGIVAAGWLPSLAAAAFLARRAPAWRAALLAAAAGIGLVAAVRAVDFVAPMPVFIDATRSLTGLLAMAAGAVVAGMGYATLTRPPA